MFYLNLKYFQSLNHFVKGLHEDVQRVTNKPRITDEATSANMAWRQYTSRESSTIVDKCVGQLKSSLTCDHCGYVSKVFPNLFEVLFKFLNRFGIRSGICPCQFRAVRPVLRIVCLNFNAKRSVT